MCGKFQVILMQYDDNSNQEGTTEKVLESHIGEILLTEQMQ